MGVKSVNLTQSINPSADPRSNIGVIGNALDAPFIENTGSCQNGGVNNLYTKSNASAESIKTMSDDDRLVELKSETVSYPQIVTRYTSFDKGTSSAIGFGSYYLNSTWILLEKGTNKYWTSTDGTIWTARTITSAGSCSVYFSVCYDGVQFVFCGLNGDIFVTYTNNHTSFSEYSFSPTIGGAIDLLISFGNSLYVIVQNVGDYSNCIPFYSSNLSTWNVGTTNIVSTYNNIAFGNNTFSVTKDASNIAYTTDGDNWSFIATGINCGKTISYINGLFWVFGNDSGTFKSAYSADCTSWTISGTASIAHDWIGNMVWTGTYYMAFGSNLSNNNSTGIYSADGIVWTPLALPYSRMWSGAAYGSNTIIVASASGAHLRIALSPGGSRSESIYRAYIDGNATGEEMIKYGVSSSDITSIYADVKYGLTTVYGAHIVGDNIVTDEIDEDTFAKVADGSTVAAPTARNCFFLRDIAPLDNTFTAYNVGGSTFFRTTELSGEITEVFTGGYYLAGGAGTSYVMLTNEIISNAVGASLASKKWRTYSMDEGTGALTQIDEKDGWFISAMYAGVMYVIGVLNDATDAFKAYSVDTAGVWTEVFTENADYAVNGIYAEYNSYKFFSLLASFSSASFTGTAVDSVNLLGYFSIIDAFTDGTVDFYLRANYNRILKSCDSLAFTVNDRYTARSVAVANVDFTYRPHFLKYGTKYYIVYRDESGNIRNVVIDDLANCETQFTRIASNLYLINTLDVYNLLDIGAEVIYPTGTDYNGAALRDDVPAYDERWKIVNDYYESEYNSSETGRPPIESQMMAGYKDQQLVYTSLTRRIYAATGDLLETNKFNSPAYLDDHGYSNIPAYALISNGYIFVDFNVYPNEAQRVMDMSFLSQIGGDFDSAAFFYLFGNDYMYDGEAVYLLDVANQDAALVCRAPGMQFVTFSQDAGYFFSFADNSLWGFNGGRTLAKVTQLNQIFPFTSDALIGEYSTKYNCLILSKGGKVLLMFDQKISRYDDSGGVALVRDNGIYYHKAASIDAISPFLYTEYAAVPCEWQSAYFKAPSMILSVTEILFYIRSTVKAAGNYTISSSMFDEQKTYTVQNETIAVGTNDYDENGYLILRLIPTVERVMGFSVGLQTSADMSILSVDANINLIGEAVVSANNTR